MIRKLFNNKFFASTFILLIGGTFSKIVGFIIKIIVTRKIGSTGIGLYSMLSPTISLLSLIAVFSYPTSISKVISEGKHSSKSIILSLLPFSLIINIIVIFITILFSNVLSNNLLKEPMLYYPIICVSLTVPFISFSSIIKGYFWGKQNMYPYMLSNFIEQLVRLIFICIFLTKLVKINLIISICFIILINILGEIASIIVMIKYYPKRKLKLNDFKLDKPSIKSVLNISIPATSSKLIGSISYFFEPIILTNMLLFMGYSKEYITHEYGVVHAYSLSILLLPQFFIQNMSTSLVPELSKHYSQNNKKMCIKRIKQIVLLSCFIGLISTIVVTMFPKFFLNIIYHTSEGVDYIKLLAPFVVLFYIEYPLINALQALGASKEAFKGTIISSIIKLLSIVLFSLLKTGMYSLVLSIITSLLSATYIYYKQIKKILS